MMPSLTTMPNQQQPTANTKRMKNLFLIFLKQFQVNEYKLLMQFLQLIIEKYNSNPSKLFGFLTSQEDIILNELINQSQQQPQAKQPATLRPAVTTTLPVVNNNSSTFRKSLRFSSARFASGFDKKIQFKQPARPIPSTRSTIRIKTELTEPSISQFKQPQVPSVSKNTNQMLEMLANRNDIIDSFVMKETNDGEHSSDDYENDDQQWETFNDASNLNEMGSDDSNCEVVTGATNSKAKSKKIRKFSEKIRTDLESAFITNNFINHTQKKTLSKRTGLTERQISKWFVHRREKLRRLEKRATDINSTLQRHYSRAIQPARQPIHFNAQSAPLSQSYSQPRNDFLYEQEQEAQNDIVNEEESWFNDMPEGENVDVEEPTQFVTHDQTEYYVDEEDDDFMNNQAYHSSSDTNISDDNPEYLPSGSQTNKRLSLDPFHGAQSAKRQCTNDLGGARPPRRLFPPTVVSHLESIFDSEKYLKDDQVHEIAQRTNLSEKQVRSWFKQRRYRYNQENRQNGIDIEIKKYNNLSQPVVNELEKAFRKNNYVYGNDKKALATRLNITPVQLERWYYYRRKKLSNGTL